MAGAAAPVDFSKAGLFRHIAETSFHPPVFYYNGPGPTPGWYQGGTTLNNNYPIQPGQAYVFFVSGSSPVRWRQAVPYAP